MNKKKVNYVKDSYTYSNRRKQVLQNKSISFRPTDDVKEFLEVFKDKEIKGNISKEINNAILLVKELRLDLFKVLDRLSLQYPLIWRKINRKNGQFITQKIRSLK